jgi:16S rRNA (adenine1518-N6/adenine1519-N6)-dimethyltransferase
MTDVRQILRRHGLEPRRELGQHFLVDARALARIVAAAELTADDAVLEIGAGVGNLTHRLAASAGRVVAVEVDRRFLPVLEAELADRPNVHLVAGDILALDPSDLMGEGPYKVVANLPYAITSAVLRHLLEARIPPQRMVVTVQREGGGANRGPGRADESAGGQRPVFTAARNCCFASRPAPSTRRRRWSRRWSG